MTNTALATSPSQEQVPEQPNIEPTAAESELWGKEEILPFGQDNTSETKFPYKESPSYIKQAVRILRSKISDQEYQLLHNERNMLLDKELAGGLTRKEQLQLQMVRWKIEGIEDARVGTHLDKLEALAQIQTNFSKQLYDFVDKVKKSVK